MIPIATATIIRGKGECQAYINGVVHKEMQKLNAELEAAKGHRDDLLTHNLKAYQEVDERPVGAFRRLRERLETLWALLWALGVEIGLWGDYLEDDEGDREDTM